MSNKYCQCPVCYGLYHPVTEKQAKTFIKMNKNHYRTMREFHQELFVGKFKTLDLFRYCHYCGTESVDFIEALDAHSNPLVYVSSIIFEKKVDRC